MKRTCCVMKYGNEDKNVKKIKKKMKGVKGKDLCTNHPNQNYYSFAPILEFEIQINQ